MFSVPSPSGTKEFAESAGSIRAPTPSGRPGAKALRRLYRNDVDGLRESWSCKPGDDFRSVYCAAEPRRGGSSEAGRPEQDCLKCLTDDLEARGATEGSTDDTGTTFGVAKVLQSTDHGSPDARWTSVVGRGVRRGGQVHGVLVQGRGRGKQDTRLQMNA